MQVLLIIVSILIIALVLLQSSKAEGASVLSGGNDSLFKNRKERGGEKFITYSTMILGVAFFLLCIFL